MLAVDDKVDLGAKTAGAAAPELSSSPEVEPQADPVRLEVRDGESKSEAWDRFFAERVDSDEVARIQVARMVRVNVRQLINGVQSQIEKSNPAAAEERVAELMGIMRGALRHGFVQPWMYEALALTMRVSHAERSEVERALMSAVDFARSPEDVLNAANYMAKIGFDHRAYQLYRDVAGSLPHRPEPLAGALAAAERLDDVAGIRWACTGILSHAWPKSQESVELKAQRVAEATLNRLRSEQRTQDADEFAAQIQAARVRDCFVRVSWTGDADVDLVVLEPSGTICSLRNPRTTGGGVILGDTYSQPGKATADGVSETYVCAKAFPGQYQVVIRRIWGKVAAGKVTVDVYTNYGSPNEEHLRQQIPLGEKDPVVEFELASGRRVEPLDEVQLAAVMEQQAVLGQAVAAQMIRPTDNAAVESYARAMRAASAGGALDPRRGRAAAVGFRPVITVLPSGTTFQGTAVISADRRYVRITPTPFFTSIGDVFTFNFGTGQQTQQGGGTGGGGGAQ